MWLIVFVGGVMCEISRIDWLLVVCSRLCSRVLEVLGLMFVVGLLSMRIGKLCSSVWVSEMCCVWLFEIRVF